MTLGDKHKGCTMVGFQTPSDSAFDCSGLPVILFSCENEECGSKGIRKDWAEDIDINVADTRFDSIMTFFFHSNHTQFSRGW